MNFTMSIILVLYMEFLVIFFDIGVYLYRTIIKIQFIGIIKRCRQKIIELYNI